MTDASSRPAGVVVGAGGMLYGSTTYGHGTLFSLTPPASPGAAWTYAQLYSFTGGSGGGGSGPGVAPAGVSRRGLDLRSALQLHRRQRRGRLRHSVRPGAAGLSRRLLDHSSAVPFHGWQQRG